MIDAGYLADVVDVIGDVTDANGRFGMSLVPRGQVLGRPLRLAEIDAEGRRVQPRLLGGAHGAPVEPGVGDEAGIEVDHDDAAIRRHQPQDRVRHVTWVIDQRPRRGMREDHRRLGGAQGVLHRVFGDVSKVDQHTEPVHLPHHIAPERRKPVMLRGVGGGVRPVDVPGVGQRHVARAQNVHLPQRRERVVDLVAALDPDQGGDAAMGVDALDVGGRVGHLEIGGVAADEGLHEVDLLDGFLDRRWSLDFRRDPHRPELSADHSGVQTGNVGHQGAGAVLQIGQRRLLREPFAKLPCQVVVTIDQRRASEDPLQSRRGGRRRRGQGRCRVTKSDKHSPA